MYYVYSVYLNWFILVCVKLFYGINCIYKCGINCVNVLCDYVIGDCNIDI